MQRVIEAVVESQTPSRSTNPPTEKPGEVLSAELSQRVYLHPDAALQFRRRRAPRASVQ